MTIEMFILAVVVVFVGWLVWAFWVDEQARRAWEAIPFETRIERDYLERERKTRDELTGRLYRAVTEILRIPHGHFEAWNESVIKDAGVQQVRAADSVKIYTTPLVEVEGHLYMLLDGSSSWGLQRVKTWIDPTGIKRYEALPETISHLGDLYKLKEQVA